MHRSATEKTALKGGVLPQTVEWTRAREAWSAEAEPRTRPTHWQFNRRNNNQQSQRYRDDRDDASVTREEYIPGPGRLTAPERGPDGALRLRLVKVYIGTVIFHFRPLIKLIYNIVHHIKSCLVVIVFLGMVPTSYTPVMFSCVDQSAI